MVGLLDRRSVCRSEEPVVGLLDRRSLSERRRRWLLSSPERPGLEERRRVGLRLAERREERGGFDWPSRPGLEDRRRWVGLLLRRRGRGSSSSKPPGM